MKKYISVLLIIIMLLLCTSSVTIFAENIANKEIIQDAENNANIADHSVSDYNMIENYGVGSGDGDYDQVDTVFLQNFTTYYFSQLKENFGYNHKGTCSYVAVAMLLSYYDTYWDDSIIEQSIDGIINENWDVVQNNFDITKSLKDNNQSPGVKNEWADILSLKTLKGLSASEKLSDSDYDNFVLSNSNIYFHLELVRLGTKELGMEYGIYPWDIVDLLEYYLYTAKGYTSAQVTIDYKNWADFEGNKKEYIIEKVKQRIPVIVSGGDISLDPWGHTYIIYDYDETNDELYCHMGWHYKKNSSGIEDTTHVSFSSIEGTLIGGAITLDFNTEHSCSNNYIDSSGNEYCSCYFPCHSEHEHEYEQIAGDASKHRYTCGCAANEVNTAYHRFNTYQSIDGTYHSETCTDCGYSVTSSHNFVYESTDEYHILTCSQCGQTSGGQQSHSWTTVNDGNLLKGERVKCQICGHIKLLDLGEYVPIIKDKKDPEEETE